MLDNHVHSRGPQARSERTQEARNRGVVEADGTLLADSGGGQTQLNVPESCAADVGKRPATKATISIDAADSHFESLRIRDRSATPIAAANNHTSASQNLRKRSAAEHGAGNRGHNNKLNKGEKNGPNTTTASSNADNRGGILSMKRLPAQADPDFDRGESGRRPVPAALFNPDLGRTQRLSASGHNTTSATSAHPTTGRSNGFSHAPTRRYCMDSQPETRPISEAQLANEVRGIYAGLVMVERKCVEIDQQQANIKKNISNEQWQALIALHRTLLHEHHDFFLASQHPAASQAIRKLATKYAMPARMWRHGIHSFLELLRHRLPASLDHMLTFIYSAYSMMTLLMESVPGFQDTWIECSGDIARYRMAIENSDLQERELWAEIARYWYWKTVDRNPNIGRIQHHLAVLARPNILQQLFFYTKSLVCIQAFSNTRDSILLLFGPILQPEQNQPSPLDQQSPHPAAIVTFVKLHGLLFTQQSMPSFAQAGNVFLSQIGSYISEGLEWREQGAHIASINLASMLEYGDESGVLMPLYRQALQQGTDRLKIASKYWSTARLPTTSPLAENFGNEHEVLKYASYFAFHTLWFVVSDPGNKDVVPHVHVLLAYLWSLVLVPQAMSYVETEVPWQGLVIFLNSLCKQIKVTDLENERFPALKPDTTSYVPEDFLMRGTIFSCFYYPTGFFDQIPMEDNDERSFESPCIEARRAERCLWLGHRIASMNRWIRFDKDATQFVVTERGLALERLCSRDTAFASVPTAPRRSCEERNLTQMDPDRAMSVLG